MKWKDSVTLRAWGRLQEDAKQRGICLRCGEKPEFKDEYEQRSYNLFTLCPKCLIPAEAEICDGGRPDRGDSDPGCDDRRAEGGERGFDEHSE